MKSNIAMILLICAVALYVLVGTWLEIDTTAWMRGLSDIRVFDLVYELKEVWTTDLIHIDPNDSYPDFIVNLVNSPAIDWTLEPIAKIGQTIVVVGQWIVWLFETLTKVVPWNYSRPATPFNWEVYEP